MYDNSHTNNPANPFGDGTCAILWSSDTCPVCKTVFHKIAPIFAERYPQIPLRMERTEDHVEWCAQNSLMSVPALIIFHEGQDVYRKAGTFGLGELTAELDRLYEFLF